MKKAILKGGPLDGKKVRVCEGQASIVLRSRRPAPARVATDAPRSPLFLPNEEEELTYCYSGDSLADGRPVFILKPSAGETYQRTGEVIGGVAVFRREGEL